jgi:putative membrane protein
MNYYHGTLNNGPYIGFHIIGFLMFVVLIFVLVRLCFGRRSYTHHNISMGSGDGAIEIVKQRYAKGEISKDEYDTLLKDLQ